ncbi:MAG: glycosyltransferase family 87 protein [Vulcanimicrobiaceae bacterium]
MPLSLSRDRVWLYGIGLGLLGLVQIRFAARIGHFWDWTDFWAAGNTVGTQSLLNPQLHHTWQIAHHVAPSTFVYMPAMAWMLAPVAHLPLAAGYVSNALFMFGCAILAALVASRIYGLPQWFTLLCVLAWAPLTQAIIIGQNSPAALLLALVAIAGIVSGNALQCGFSIGALLYKPLYALPLICVLLARRQWLALTIVIGCMGAWYMASTAAVAGDWGWPVQYIRALSSYVAPDFALNAYKAVGIPGLLARAGVPIAFSTAVAYAALLLTLPIFARIPRLEAASIAPLLGLVASPHAWGYDAVMILPALWWLLITAREPWRTRLFAAAYIAAPLYLAAQFLQVQSVAIVAIGGAFLWLVHTGRTNRLKHGNDPCSNG